MSPKNTVLFVFFVSLLLIFGWLLNITKSVQAGKELSIVVTTLADELIPNGNCTLREAVLAANNNMVIDACPAGTSSIQADVITFAVSGTILLTHPDGELLLEEAVIIEGNGRSATILDAQHNSRIFYITNGRAVTLKRMTLQNGATDPTVVNGTGGAILNGPVPLFLEDVLVQDSRAEGGLSGGGGGIASLGRLTVIDSEIRNNSADDSYNGGGGILAQGESLLIENSVISGNSARNDNTDGGGGIFFLGEAMTVTGSLIEDNTADFSEGGGGILAFGGSLTVGSSLIQGNSADEGQLGGGGILCDCNLSILNSTIRENSAAFAVGGGGIYGITGSESQIRNSTISYNSAAFASQGGGGIWLEIGQLEIANSTISLNTADSSGLGGGGLLVDLSADVALYFSTVANNTAVSAQGGGLYNEGSTFSGNSIFAGNSPANCYAPNQMIPNGSGGFNLSSDNSCELSSPGDLPGVDPLLGDLQDNGGPTETHALPANSPAVGAGDCWGTVTTDQRGVPRPYGWACDIGAFEYTPYDLYLPVVIK